MAETHKRDGSWWRWSASLDDLHELAQTTVGAVGEQVAGYPTVDIKVELADREMVFPSADDFVFGFGVEELRTLRSIDINAWDINQAVQAHISVGSVYAASMHVSGLKRPAVDAVAVRCEGALKRGARRLDMRPDKLYRIAGVIAAVVMLLCGLGIMAVTGVFLSAWWVIGLTAAATVAFACGAAFLGARVAGYLAPWLELLEPDEQTRWQQFRAGSLKSGERFAWLVIGALVVFLFNLLR